MKKLNKHTENKKLQFYRVKVFHVTLSDKKSRWRCDRKQMDA